MQFYRGLYSTFFPSRRKNPTLTPSMLPPEYFRARQSTSTSHWYSVSYPRVPVILNGSVPKVLQPGMTEYSPVFGVLRPETTEYSRVPGLLRLDMTEYSQVPGILRPEMTEYSRGPGILRLEMTEYSPVSGVLRPEMTGAGVVLVL